MLFIMRFTIALCLLAGFGNAFAVECRMSMQPLLLNAQPPAADVQRVRDICQAEADAGDAEARYQLALTYLGLAGDWAPERAVPLIRDAAGRGVAEAQYWLAWQYESGPLLEHDGAAALGWYLRAAEADHRLALARLAQAYDAGELGLPAEPRKAAEYRARQARCSTNAAGQGPL
jgi:TPR repeat protein